MKKIVILVVFVLLLMGLTACSSVDKEEWQAQYDLGMKCLEEGNYEEAVIAFTKAIEIDAKSTVSYIRRGDAYTGLAKGTDDLEKAKEYCEMALQDYEEAENLGSEDVEDRKLELEKLLEEVIGKIEEIVEKERETVKVEQEAKEAERLKKEEETKELLENLYDCLMSEGIESGIELMRQENYRTMSSNIKSEYLLYEGEEKSLVVYLRDIYAYYYFGEFIDEKKEGNGIWIQICKYSDPRYQIYDGEWENDLPNGNGNIYRIDESDTRVSKIEISGTYKNGLYDGQIKEIYYKNDGYVIEYEPITAVNGVYLEIETDKLPYEWIGENLPESEYLVSFAKGENGGYFSMGGNEEKIHCVFGFE